MKAITTTAVWIFLTFVATASVGANSELHPPVPLLDSNGVSVIESGLPVSLLNSCDDCHDTAYISETNSHGWLGDSALLRAVGENGVSGLAYELDVIERGTDGCEHEPGADLNCLLCHMDKPDYDSYQIELKAGNPDWASTAMLLDTQIVSRNGNGFAYNTSVFDENNNVPAEILGITFAKPNHCGHCHEPVYFGSEPLNIHNSAAPGGLGFAGQVFSSQRPSASAMNIAGKNDLTGAWDVHAERLVDCVDCHHATNSPTFYGASHRSNLVHLRFDPRVLNLREYLKKPSHSFAPGADHRLSTTRNAGNIPACADCHDAKTAHEWLPKREQHFNSLSCEVCHIPRLHMPGRMVTDWTLLTTTGEPITTERGIDGDFGNPTSLIEGYEPILLQNEDGLLAPYNLSTMWYWVAGESAEPVTIYQLQSALLINGNHRAELISAFDDDGDCVLSRSELRLDTEEKTAVVARLLNERGINNPRIDGVVTSQPVNHSVVSGKFVEHDCASCHQTDSRIYAEMEVADYLPGGKFPSIEIDAGLNYENAIQLVDGRLVFMPESGWDTHYILGHSRWQPGNILGALAIIGVVAMVLLHGLLRFRASRLKAREEQ